MKGGRRWQWLAQLTYYFIPLIQSNFTQSEYKALRFIIFV